MLCRTCAVISTILIQRSSSGLTPTHSPHHDRVGNTVGQVVGFTKSSKDELNIWGENFQVHCQNISHGASRASTYWCPKTITCLRQQVRQNNRSLEENKVLSWCDGCVGFCSQRCWHSGSYSRALRVTDPLDTSPIRWCMSLTSFTCWLTYCRSAQ